jgi:D-sedoheptulose 7-phosphate isomerase
MLVSGNGGSAADADHIVGELMKGFLIPRRISDELGGKLIEIAGDDGRKISEKLQNALPTISLTNHNSLNTAFSNDVDGDMCFAQQTLGYGVKGDVFLGISTSGNSKNVLYAAIVAKAIDLKVIALTGVGGGRLAQIADVTIAVDEKETYKVQELHLPVYHCLCMMLEQRFFGGIGA